MVRLDDEKLVKGGMIRLTRFMNDGQRFVVWTLRTAIISIDPSDRAVDGCRLFLVDGSDFFVAESINRVLVLLAKSQDQAARLIPTADSTGLDRQQNGLVRGDWTDDGDGSSRLSLSTVRATVYQRGCGTWVASIWRHLDRGESSPDFARKREAKEWAVQTLERLLLADLAALNRRESTTRKELSVPQAVQHG